MARPGVTVTTRDAPPSAGPPIRTGTAFMIGLAQKGSVTAAKKVESLSDFERLYGARQTYSPLYDAVDVFFREGGGSAYISRVIANGAAQATATLQDADAPTLILAARDPGTYANGWTAAVTIAGGSTTLAIRDAGGTVLESFTTTSAGSKAAILARTWTYITVSDPDPTDGDPVAAASIAFSGGLDDVAGTSDADHTEALDRIPAALGPGQVLAPGNVDTDVQAALLAHAEANNRVALLDAPNTAVRATIEAHATTLRATGRGDYGLLLTPWVKVPGAGATPAATRTVPYSAVQAGLEARRDRLESQNVPAAGRSYPFSYVTELVTEWTDPDRTALIDLGVNTAHTVGSVRETYGYRSLASPTTDPNWVQFNFARLRMAITARAEDIGESFLFEQMDGKGLKLSEFGSAISGMLLDFFVLGSLYGDSPDDAFRVDVGSSVNTAETIAAGELHAVAAVRMSPHAEMVVIEFVKTPITQAV